MCERDVRGCRIVDIGIQGNGVYIGVRHYQDRKNASLVVERGNVGIVLGNFRNEKAVEEFKKALKELLGGGE